MTLRHPSTGSGCEAQGATLRATQAPQGATLYALLTRWVGTGKESDPYIMEVARHYPQATVCDLVGHLKVPAVPNVALASVVCDAPVAALLRDDPRYDGLILWQWTDQAATGAPSTQGNLDRTESVDAAAAEKMRAGLERLGLTAAESAEFTGAPVGRTRAELCEALIARVRSLPSAR